MNTVFFSFFLHSRQVYHRLTGLRGLTFTASGTKTAEFANSVDPNEAAHNEPPHQDLHCLPSSL